MFLWGQKTTAEMQFVTLSRTESSSEGSQSALVGIVRRAGVGIRMWSVMGQGAGAQAEAPWVHHTFDVELIFGHCIEKPINFIFLLWALLLSAFFVILCGLWFKSVGHRKTWSPLGICQILEMRLARDVWGGCHCCVMCSFTVNVHRITDCILG